MVQFGPMWCSIPLLICPVVEWALHLKTEECMQLYLVQHGAAKSEAEDPQRSLTTEGTNPNDDVGPMRSDCKMNRAV